MNGCLAVVKKMFLFYYSFSHRFTKNKKLSFESIFLFFSIRMPFCTNFEIKSRKSEQKLFKIKNRIKIRRKKLLEYGKPFPKPSKSPNNVKKNTPILPPVCATADMTKLNNELIFDSILFLFFFYFSFNGFVVHVHPANVLCLEYMSQRKHEDVQRRHKTNDNKRRNYFYRIGEILYNYVNGIYLATST